MRLNPSISDWHKATFPNHTREQQILKFFEEGREYFLSGSLEELADFCIVSIVLNDRYDESSFANIAFNEAMNSKFSLEDIQYAIEKKMEINKKRHWVLKDGVYRHD